MSGFGYGMPDDMFRENLLLREWLQTATELNTDLLAALKDLVQASDGHPGSVAQRNQARSAIDKAKR